MGFSVVRLEFFGWRLRSKQAQDFIKKNPHKHIRNEYTLDYYIFNTETANNFEEVPKTPEKKSEKTFKYPRNPDSSDSSNSSDSDESEEKETKQELKQEPKEIKVEVAGFDSVFGSLKPSEEPLVIPKVVADGLEQSSASTLEQTFSNIFKVLGISESTKGLCEDSQAGLDVHGKFYMFSKYNENRHVEEYYISLDEPDQTITGGRGSEYYRRSGSDYDSDSDQKKRYPQPTNFKAYNTVYAIARKLGALEKDAKSYWFSMLL
jgi:hypothetical protein